MQKLKMKFWIIMSEDLRKEALELSEKMIKLAPNNPDIICMRAKALSITGKNHRA